MPELPEVELVGRYLRPHVLGRRIRRVTTTAASYFFLTTPATLRRRLPGETILTLTRVGKYLLAELTSGSRLMLHLGMTGQLLLDGARTPRLVHDTPFVRDAHTHLIVEFCDKGPSLLFRDTRKFGKVRLLAPGARDPRLDKLGPDALGVTGHLLFSAARKRRVKVKSLLLDQTVMAGIGNIYADESLFLAGIHPERPAVSLREAECATLAQVIRRVLNHSIRAGGSSIDDYIHPDGSAGGFQQRFRVHAREGEPCHKCKTTIERIVIGQRSSHFCGRCQPRDVACTQ